MCVHVDTIHLSTSSCAVLDLGNSLYLISAKRQEHDPKKAQESTEAPSVQISVCSAPRSTENAEDSIQCPAFAQFCSTTRTMPQKRSLPSVVHPKSTHVSSPFVVPSLTSALDSAFLTRSRTILVAFCGQRHLLPGDTKVCLCLLPGTWFSMYCSFHFVPLNSSSYPLVVLLVVCAFLLLFKSAVFFL